MFSKSSNNQLKIFAPKPIRRSMISKTRIESNSVLIEKNLLQQPKKKMASALEFVSFAEIEQDFCVMRRSHGQLESNEELFLILSNRNTKGNDDQEDSFSQNDSFDDFNRISHKTIERSSNPFVKNFNSNDE